MLRSLLVVVTWMQGGPAVQTQLLDSPAQCRLAAQSAAQLIQLQAHSNMNAPHNDLLLAQDAAGREWSLSTAIGREVARLRCADLEGVAAVGEPKLPPAASHRLPAGPARAPGLD
jgi:hypothetical protein